MARRQPAAQQRGMVRRWPIRAGAFLAQQLDPQQPQDVRGTAPSQRQMPNGQAGTQNGMRNGTQLPQNQDNFNNGLGNNTGGNASGTPFVAEIGVLQVGPDGSGRVENQLEGMAVRNLAGMNVSVMSTVWGGGNGFARNQPNDPRKIDRRTDRNAPGNDPMNSQPGQTSPGQGVVATGVIQLMDGQTRPNVGDNGQQPDTGERRDRVPASNPRQDFDPATPR